MTDHAPASCDEEGVSLEARLSSLSLPSGLVTSQNRDFWLYALKKQREMREKLEAIFQVRFAAKILKCVVKRLSKYRYFLA